MPGRKQIWSALCAFGLLGCGGAPPDAPSAHWALDSLFAIGTEGDSLEVQRVRSVLWSSTSELFVADGGARRVRVVDAAGHWLRDIGRDGSGPGEYGSPSSLALFGDTLAVLDLTNARIGLFGRTGVWLGSLPAPRISGPEIRLFRVPPGEVYAFGVQPTADGRARLAFVRHTNTGPRDTVARDTAQGPVFGGVTCQGSDQGLRFFSSPWTVRRLDAPGPMRTLVTARNDGYEIVRRSVQGETLTVFRGSSSPIPVTDAEWDAAGSELREYLAADAGAKCDRRAMDRPATKPVLRAFFWSTDGTLWVERYAAHGFSFDVFDSTGTLLATMPAPERLAGVEPHVAGDRLALVTETPDGAHVVRAYRVRRP